MKINLEMSKRSAFRLLLLGVCVFANAGCGGNASTAIPQMRCEYTDTPVGIDTENPRFAWVYTSGAEKNGFRQKSFRINIATSEQTLAEAGSRGDVWSADVENVTAYAVYDGSQKFSPHTWYYWNVIATGENGEELVSPTGKFRTAKISSTDWSAEWISDSHDKSYGPAPMFRKDFEVRDGLKEAFAYISAAAYYKMTINGKRATENRLDPGYTHYDKRNLYATHDVTKLLEAGGNAVGVVLGNGFYNADAPVATWDFENARWRNRPRFICELHLVYGDGAVETVITDGSWKTATGPLVYDNIYSGDNYDARLEMPGWDTPGYAAAEWKTAQTVPAPSSMLVSQVMPPVKAGPEIKAVGMKSFGDTVFVYDFGKNMAGVCNLKVSGQRGTKVTFVHGELLKGDGRIQMGNLDIYYKPLEGIEFQTDIYILKGEGVESFTPEFTYHGFQYVEVKADKPVKMDQESLTAYFVHTAAEPVGKFACSNELFNKIWAATNQSYLSNLHSIPTDCPQREKNGWTADGHVSIDIGLLNFDGIKLYEKWLDDFIDNQREDGRISGIIPSSGWGYDDWIGPVWDAAMFIIPDALERYYGTAKYIEKIYPACEKYLAYLAAREDENGTVTYGIGDWVYYDTQTPTDYTTTCFYYLDNKLMAEFADKTGRDGSKYAKKAAELKELINARYFDSEKALYANGSQASLGTALWMGIVPEGYEQTVADNLNRIVEANGYYLDFGVLGSKFVPRMLTKYGYVESAYKMAAKEDAPSWGAWINLGFTTLAERWVLDLVGFRDSSVNHVFLGDISAWMVNCIAGINYDENDRGFDRIIISPHFIEDLDWAEAEYNSVKGLIKSSWKREGGKVKLTVTIPVNTTAAVDAGGKTREISAGTHTFTF